MPGHGLNALFGHRTTAQLQEAPTALYSLAIGVPSTVYLHEIQ